MATLTRLVDAAIGETRELLLRDGRAVALRVRRWPELGPRVLWGEVYRARARTIDTLRRGAFLDLGAAGTAFLRMDGEGRAPMGDVRLRVVEGMTLRVAIVREAARGKAPVCALIAEDAGVLGLVDRHTCDVDLDAATPAQPDDRERIDAAIDEALARSVTLPDGGRLTIEPTAAFVAIDVDASDPRAPGDSRRFIRDLNVAAAEALARQLRIRDLGGIVVIDFVSMTRRDDRTMVTEALRRALADDTAQTAVAPFSRFGVVELSRAQLRAPLHEVMCDASGRRSVSTMALVALRAGERAALMAKGRPVTLLVNHEVRAWLDAPPMNWRSLLRGRVASPLSVTEGPWADRERIETATH